MPSRCSAVAGLAAQDRLPGHCVDFCPFDEASRPRGNKLTTQEAASLPEHGETADQGSARPDGTRRQEILDAAAGVFASEGYVGCSLKDISRACGILPGSMYHHFESKEAIAVELVERYHVELVSLGEQALRSLRRRDAEGVFSDILTLARQLARLSVQHRAALQLTLYDPPSGAGPRLVELARWTPEAVRRAMDRLLRRGRTAGLLDPAISPLVLAEHIYTCMRRLAITSSDVPGAERAAVTLCHVLLGGVGPDTPGDPVLDSSAAMAVATEKVRSWRAEIEAGRSDKRDLVTAVARAEFARRGYEATTIRDIASAAGLATGTVYRFVDSKESLLKLIMGSYYTRLSDAYIDVLASGSGMVERLDAINWININSLELFRDEFEIQHAWFREVPPDADSMLEIQTERTLELNDLMEKAVRAGELRMWELPSDPATLEMFVTSMHNLLWTPPDIVGRLGQRRAHAYVRATLLRGAVLLDPLAGVAPAP